MNNIELLGITVSFTACLALIVSLIFCFWWFSGYLCSTFNWYDLDQNAQIITCIVLLTIGGSGVVHR